MLEYVAPLRRLAITCEFGNFLDQALRDRFVCGMKSESTQKKLLAERDLTLARAQELARGMEVASQDTRDMRHLAVGASGSTDKIHHTDTSGASGSGNSTPAGSCHRCGKGDHDGRACKFRQAKCYKCGKTGHIAPVCRSTGNHKGQHRVRDTHCVDTEGSDVEMHTFTVNRTRAKPIRVELQVAGQPLTMEVDTGAAVSILSESVFLKKFPEGKLESTSMVLRTYTGETMKVLGVFPASVRYQQQDPCDLELVIVAGDGPCLLGRNWLEEIRLDWYSIASMSKDRPNTALKRILEEYDDVFACELGTIRPFKSTLAVAKDARPKFYKARPVPFSLRAGVEEALDRLEADGVVEKISHSEWAAPIVTVPKKNGDIRICGDYKVTVNSVLEVDKYPLPRPEDIFATLSGGKKFTTLDLAQAYNQMELDPESQKFVVVNTHRGLYKYKRLPFGIASAPAMDQILQGMEHVTCYIDDVLITGVSEEEHLQNLTEVLRRLREHGVRLGRGKCHYMQDSVEYLGHRIDAHGLHATEDKLKAISEAPEPSNVQELRAFLGLLNYYGRLIPNRASLTRPLNRLLSKDCLWHWSKECTKAFELAKKTLLSSSVLTHYNPSLPLKLAGDASSYGVGAVISHMMEDGTERPIAFASRTLSPSEQNYSQLEKEALSLIFGVKKFHLYLYGRSFTLITDHKPLTTILGPKHGIPPLAAARLQRWSLILAAHRYDIEYHSTGAHANADSLSRLPLKSTEPEVISDEPSVFNVSQLERLPVTAKQLKAATRTDPILSKVLHFVKSGWPKQVESDIRPFWFRRLELTVEGECLLWGIRVLVPQKLRDRLLDELHQDHPGISRMKAVARSYIWWPGLDKAIENLAKSCASCQAVKHSPAVAPLQPWVWPDQPWKRVHLDFAGPFQGAMFLVAVDAHSKWPEVHIMRETTAAKTINVLHTVFSTFGLPEHLVTDNGPQFVSEDFAMFCRLNGIKHIRCAPYHPASNGLAERFVQSLKSALKASVNSGLPLQRRVQNFLLNYRSTPHATTGVSPSSLFLHRHIRTRLDLLRPDCESAVRAKHTQQKLQHDQRARERAFFVGQSVMARNMRSGADWVPAIVVERLGSYLVETADRLLWKRHVDLLKEMESRVSSEFQEVSGDLDVAEPTPLAPPTQAAVETDPQEPTSTSDQDLELHPLEPLTQLPNLVTRSRETSWNYACNETVFEIS